MPDQKTTVVKRLQASGERVPIAMTFSSVSVISNALRLRPTPLSLSVNGRRRPY